MAGSGRSHSFEDHEVVTFETEIGVEQADVASTTGFQPDSNRFEGHQLVDYDEFVDRNESLSLMSGYHRLEVWSQTEQSGVHVAGAYVEISASPATVLDPDFDATSTVDGDVVGAPARVDDTIDLVGRPLGAHSSKAFNATGDNTGGGGSAGDDSVVIAGLPPEVAAFHPRDELFANGTIEVHGESTDDVFARITGQHIYGVSEG